MPRRENSSTRKCPERVHDSRGIVENGRAFVSTYQRVSEGLKNLSNLPNAILRNRIQHGLVFTNGCRTVKGQRRKHHAAPIEQFGQITPYVAALTEKHRHDGDGIAPVCYQLFDSRGQIRRHQFEKRER